VEDSVGLLCENKGEAIKAAKQLVDGHDVELWQRDRKIERFNRPGQQKIGPICEQLKSTVSERKNNFRSPGLVRAFRFGPVATTLSWRLR